MRHEQKSGSAVEIVDVDQFIGRSIDIGRDVGIAEEVESHGIAYVPGFLIEFFLTLFGVFDQGRNTVL